MFENVIFICLSWSLAGKKFYITIMHINIIYLLFPTFVFMVLISILLSSTHIKGFIYDRLLKYALKLYVECRVNNRFAMRIFKII